MLPWNNWNIVESGAKQDWFDWFIEFNSTFSNIMATSFSGGRSRSTQREPPTMGKQLVNFVTCGCESSAPFFNSPGHVSYCHRFSSVNISYFNLLFRNHWANCNQTLVEWSLDGPLPKLCSVIPTSIQDGHQAKNRKTGGWIFNCPLLL